MHLLPAATDGPQIRNTHKPSFKTRGRPMTRKQRRTNEYVRVCQCTAFCPQPRVSCSHQMTNCTGLVYLWSRTPPQQRSDRFCLINKFHLWWRQRAVNPCFLISHLVSRYSHAGSDVWPCMENQSSVTSKCSLGACCEWAADVVQYIFSMSRKHIGITS